jgi:hypothetical protein
MSVACVVGLFEVRLCEVRLFEVRLFFVAERRFEPRPAF